MDTEENLFKDGMWLNGVWYSFDKEISKYIKKLRTIFPDISVATIMIDGQWYTIPKEVLLYIHKLKAQIRELESKL